jgi:hypothetical protein
VNDSCDVVFLPGAARTFRKIGRVDALRVPLIEDAIDNIVDNGWILSVHSGVIKVLDPQRQVGEIRDLGSGGYRLFFFWHDAPSTRILCITTLEKKSKLKGKARVKDFIDAADALRRRYLDEQEEREGWKS